MRPIEEAPAWWAAREAETAPESGGKPARVEDAICVCSFVETAGTPHAPAPETGFDVLHAAGIASDLDTRELQPERAGAPPQLEYEVLVPGALNLKALRRERLLAEDAETHFLRARALTHDNGSMDYAGTR